MGERETVVGDAPNDRLLVPRFKVALLILKESRHQFDGLLSNQPSSEFLAEFRSAMPEVTPPEQPSAMPEGEYCCWQVADVLVWCWQRLRAIWHRLVWLARNEPPMIAFEPEPGGSVGEAQPGLILIEGGLDTGASIDLMTSIKRYGLVGSQHLSDSLARLANVKAQDKSASVRVVAA